MHHVTFISHFQIQVRVCKRRDRRFSVLRYNAYDRLDLSGGLSSSEASSSKGSGNQEVFLRRENNLRQFKAANNILDLPTRGAGSEFGQEAKEEARLRRMGVSRQGYRAEDQPWLLTVGKGSAAKRYRGVREGNVSANVRYFIFCQTKDGNFDAYPVHEWYKLNPEVSYRYLRDEEAEAEYNRRHKTMNLFNVMVKRKLVDDTTEEGLTEAKEASARLLDTSINVLPLFRPIRIKAGLAATVTDAAAKAEAKGTNGSGGAGGSKRSRSFLLTELDEWNELSDEDEEDEDEEEGGKAGAEAATAADGDDSGLLGADSDGEGGGRAGGARGGKKSKTAAARRKQRAAAIVARKRRGTKQRQRRRKNTTLADSSDEEDDANEEAWDESEPDDHEGDEVDYITDSSSDEEKLSADEREQIYQETGVDEEQGLKALLTDISELSLDSNKFPFFSSLFWNSFMPSPAPQKSLLQLTTPHPYTPFISATKILIALLRRSYLLSQPLCGIRARCGGDSDENPDELKPNDVHAGDEGGEGAGDRDGSDAEAGGRKHSSKSGREGEGGNGSRGGKHKRHRHHHHRNGSRVDENESSSGSSDDDDDDENASSSSSSSTSSSDSSSTSSDSDFDMAPDDPERLARMAQKKAEMMRKISDKVSASSASTAVTGSPSSKDSAANPPTTVMPKRPAETGATEEMTEGGAVKRLKMADNAATPATVAATAAPPPPPPDDELTAHVRKYLMRKPITVTELLKKIRIKKLVPKTDDAQTLLANALRRLRPIKQIINGQHVLSLKR
ncbi:unnamed protein product [Schistocephalus solidus]|uniref:Transcription initiation factor IIF subunit alpha n=1 Tax=Schistocephalus solidus TaxID=70667 RepID=A0A183T3P4_SCHSO|nr:unnamed protein product [Schistocephalus solidus]